MPLHYRERNKEVIVTKIIDMIKFGLFCVLLFVVVIEFMISFNLSSISNLEQLLTYMALLGNLSLLDKVLTVGLLGVFAFPQDDKK